MAGVFLYWNAVAQALLCKTPAAPGAAPTPLPAFVLRPGAERSAALLRGPNNTLAQFYLYTYAASVNFNVFLNFDRCFCVIPRLKNYLFIQIPFLELFFPVPAFSHTS